MFEEDVEGRRGEIGRVPVLGRIGNRLDGFLDRLRSETPALPGQKALLSREGGVCAADGSRLAFDPFEPFRHACPACGAVHRGELHHRAWIWRYHLWLSERAVHFALLHRLGVAPDGAARAAGIVSAYAGRYREYPNRDNVLGPTRPFFSTYHESIWLLQLVIAAGLLDGTAEISAVRGEVESMVGESAALIRSFDEGWSNRQVWNACALIAAGRWLGDRDLVQAGIGAPHGVVSLLKAAVSPEGWWHEGENYHFFALRGFVFAAELLRETGQDLYRWGDGRLGRMFVAPLDTVLPDLTLPARGDSPFGVSVRQPRFAELWELGWRRTGDARLESVLAALYAGSAPDPVGMGIDEIGEVEANRAPGRLDRGGLGWKALLWMRGDGPGSDPLAWQGGSTLVGGNRLVVLRPRPGDLASVECGSARAGHAHPDALHLTLALGGVPWLQDFGTGSYVSESLYWYRSTLSHNAPGLAGSGQGAGRGWCSGLGRGGGWEWCRVDAEGQWGPGSRVVRSVVFGPRYVVDVVDVQVPAAATVDLPIHPIGAVDPAGGEGRPGAPATLRAAPAGHETGYDAIAGATALDPSITTFRVTGPGGSVHLVTNRREGESVFLANAPGPPSPWLGDADALPFLIRRAPGPGRWVQAYHGDGVAIREIVAGREGADAVEVRFRDGGRCRLRLLEDGVEVDDEGRVTFIEGALPPPRWSRPAPRRPLRVRCLHRGRRPTLDDAFAGPGWDGARELGRSDYRRGEDAYPGEDAFSARVAFTCAGSRIAIAVDVRKAELVFRADGAARLDNEVPDIHSDGIQCYVGSPGGARGVGVDAGTWQGYLVSPGAGGALRVRVVRGTAGSVDRVMAAWQPTGSGYRMLVECDVGTEIRPGMAIPVNVVVNEMRRGRERRAGQLALSGGGGWVYLRGDREPPSEAAVAVVE